MRKVTAQDPNAPWIARLKTLMEARGFNPRSLSVKAGLNPTAVRDMLEGRVKYPRYDTVEALAEALAVTPAHLMSGTALPETGGSNDPLADEDLGLLTEIIARLQETAEAYRHTLAPEDFAAMVTTIYRQMKPAGTQKTPHPDPLPEIRQLMDYERLRRKKTRA